jgi:AraC-like DNA-binding protein
MAGAKFASDASCFHARLALGNVAPEARDKTQFDAFLPQYAPLFGSCDMALTEKPTVARCEIAAIGKTAITRQSASINRCTRNVLHIANDKLDAFQIGFNLHRDMVRFSQNRREGESRPGGAVLTSSASPLDIISVDGMSALCVSVDGKILRDRVPQADDRVLRAIDPMSPALQYLRGYAQFVLAQDDAIVFSGVAAHVESALIDLVSLVLGAIGDSAALAKMRGLRAARYRAIQTAISASYMRSDFSISHVCNKTGLSQRYIQDLLQEAGTSFSERVLELRLERVRAMLEAPSCDGKRVIDIALAAGFNDISYFNRAFRRRFGDTPSSVRDHKRR